MNLLPNLLQWSNIDFGFHIVRLSSVLLSMFRDEMLVWASLSPRLLVWSDSLELHPSRMGLRVKRVYLHRKADVAL